MMVALVAVVAAVEWWWWQKHRRQPVCWHKQHQRHKHAANHAFARTTGKTSKHDIIKHENHKACGRTIRKS